MSRAGPRQEPRADLSQEEGRVHAKARREGRAWQRVRTEPRPVWLEWISEKMAEGGIGNAGRPGVCKP